MSKKGGLLVALLDKGPSGKTPRQPMPEPEESEPAPLSSEGGAFDSAAEALCSSLGVPAGKRGAVKAALKQAISACKSEGYEEE